MKKYRLIKTYPSSPDKGIEVTWGNWGLSGNCYQGSQKGEIYRFDKNSIEGYPDNWEEMDKKEYEILSFVANTSNSTGQPSIKLDSGEHSWVRDSSPSRHTEESLLKRSDYSINSIKRLSDGMVFKVGDYLNYNVNRKYDFTITNIKITDDNEVFLKGDGGAYTTMDSNKISILSKPLFITVDGVPINEGDSYWCINTAEHLWSFYEQTARARTQLSRPVIAFKHKSNADEYILMNKPCLSINEIATVYVTANMKANAGYSETFYKQALALQTLVKSKL